MKYVLGKKFLRRYFVQDEEGRDLFYVRRKFPLFWRYKFVDVNGREIFSIKKKWAFGLQVYELKQGNEKYAKVIREPNFQTIFQALQTATG